MSDVKIARRYARALFLIAGGSVERADAHLQGLSAMAQLFETRDIERVLISPVMPPDLKRDVLGKALELSKIQGEPLKEVKGLVECLIASLRVDILPSLTTAFSGLVDGLKNTARVDVGSPEPLSREEFEAIIGAVKSASGKNIVATNSVDREILGGFVVKIANNVVDFSLRSRLEAISQHVVQ